ncbi:MAG: hypothetical protein KF901_14665 [Myxococcales bacterium]|nr:hypothetical protein [Myxococcales bacterium]
MQLDTTLRVVYRRRRGMRVFGAALAIASIGLMVTAAGLTAAWTSGPGTSNRSRLMPMGFTGLGSFLLAIPFVLVREKVRVTWSTP